MPGGADLSEASEAAQIVRGLVHRITVMAGEDDEPQPIEIEAGSSINMQTSEQCCESGCGGVQVSQIGQSAPGVGALCAARRTEQSHCSLKHMNDVPFTASYRSPTVGS